MNPTNKKNKLKFAVVCSSNQNRSMEAHNFLSKRGFDVKSYGSGTCVKLPGPAADRPNIYQFNVPYDYMYNDLLQQDRNLYTNNGLLHMLDRNRRIKAHPERFQDSPDKWDVVLTCEERVFDQVVEHLADNSSGLQPVHIVNIDIQDNHEEATIAAFIIVDLCQRLEEEADHLDDIIADVVAEFDSKHQHRNMYHHVYYI